MFSRSFLFALLASSISQVTLAAPLTTVGRQTNCTDVTVIHARGTFEPFPIGLGVGPPFRDALATALGSKTLTFQGVDYPANVIGFLEGGDPKGAAAMTADINAVASACPNTKIVMSGYSQGGQVVHLSANQLSAAIQNRLSAIVVFGDPDNGRPFPGNLNAIEKTFCAAGDNICDGGILILPPHLSYGNNAAEAASFVISHL